MGELAVRAVDFPPLLSDRQDDVDLRRRHGVQATPPGARSSRVPTVRSRARPAMHPVGGDAQQATRPDVGTPAATASSISSRTASFVSPATARVADRSGPADFLAAAPARSPVP
jgi:hypothetical protein